MNGSLPCSGYSGSSRAQPLHQSQLPDFWPGHWGKVPTHGDSEVGRVSGVCLIRGVSQTPYEQVWDKAPPAPRVLRYATPRGLRRSAEIGLSLGDVVSAAAPRVWFHRLPPLTLRESQPTLFAPPSVPTLTPPTHLSHVVYHVSFPDIKE